MIRENKITEDENAVSEVVGFILIFGMVILAIGIIYAFGYPMLQSNMETSVFESSEQSFIVIQSNMKAVAFEQSPVKTTKMKIQTATLAYSNESFIQIDYNGTTIKKALGRIELIQDEKKIVYESGGVFKRYDRDSQVLVSNPHIFSTVAASGENVVSVGIISLYGNAASSGGGGIISLSMEHNTSQLTQMNDNATLTLTVNSSLAPRWATHLEEEGFTITSSSDTEVTAQMTNTNVIIGEHVVDVEIT
ncbi:hypothetical protein J2755_001971 [Methanohalophilus levihalophilus]|uniref:DUF7289 family protein n=1 Tax=Methanohalophilus levihalophilus TaxID=1431282 RepID=UPI001AE92C2D|nr:hypothetical protein [Methanohalophilus levihalophilus]MBP2031023.1 hypothetical protein [Methanohalophilus levihalophilus]